MAKTQLSIGKLRGLAQCTSPSKTFTVLALDHRQNLRRSLNPQNPTQVSDTDLTSFKLEVTAALAGEATAVLLDPEYSAGQAIAAGTIPGNRGLIVALEATGYSGDPTARQSQLLPGWSPEKARRMGASMVKLLVYYHPNAPTAAEIEDFVRQVAVSCRGADLALMLEPLSYPLDANSKHLPPAEREEVVIETARRLSPLGIDILKAEFPLIGTSDKNVGEWEQACAAITSASHVPWILLSAAVDFDTYLQQVTAACHAGATGVAVGRAVWQEAITLAGLERTKFLQTTALERLAQLNDLCSQSGTPWTEYFAAAEITPHWYKDY